MDSGGPLTGVQRAAIRLQELIDRLGDGAIIGGVAVGLHSDYRSTHDVDAILWAESIEPKTVLEEAERMGIVPRVPNVLEDAQRILVMRLRDNKSGVPLDLSLAFTPFEKEAIERSISIQTPIGELRIATPEDIVIMKGVAQREQDLADIVSIAAHNPALDWGRIEFWLTEFGNALELPDLWSTVKALKHE